MTQLERWENSYKERNLIKDFLNFAAMKYGARLGEKYRYDNCAYDFYPIDEDPILDDYFQIDQDKLDQERRALLEKAQNMEASK